MSGDVYELIKNDPDTKDKFIFLHNANDSQLAWLYAHAMFTVYPSFYEGWGLPIAESLLRGTPCLASETSSMQEIAGDLVPYFSPFSSDQIMNTIASYANDPKALKALKTRVAKEYKTTTWDMSYAEVADGIKKLA
jgi:glycosyltransferase involved in cell wall biosynthesis